MKKEKSGRIIFFVYAIFLFIVAFIAWNMGEGYLCLSVLIGGIFVSAGACLQLVPSEKKVLNGYGLAGMSGIALSMFSLFRLIFPTARGLVFVLFIASLFVSYHCFKTLSVKG